MRLSQVMLDDGMRGIVVTDAAGSFVIEGYDRTRDLALHAYEAGLPLSETALSLPRRAEVDLARLYVEGRILPPVDHQDMAHCLITGTGLSHLGSASARNAMHQDPGVAEADLTDSMKMFQMGVAGGRPAPGQTGVQPEWFYKGDGRWIVAPGEPIVSPSFATDAGEEPEIAGVYVIAGDGTPLRLGFCLANEFSDHAMEKVNYLYLSHSKLRPSGFGPELLVGPLPQDVRGHSRIRRGGEVLWQSEFQTGEANMSHSIANLEQHHFKYAGFRFPGDVHYHMFGTATLSFSDGVQCRDGDVFEIEIPEFGLPLRNPLTTGDRQSPGIHAL